MVKFLHPVLPRGLCRIGHMRAPVMACMMVWPVWLSPVHADQTEAPVIAPDASLPAQSTQPLRVTGIDATAMPGAGDVAQEFTHAPGLVPIDPMDWSMR